MNMDNSSTTSLFGFENSKEELKSKVKVKAKPTKKTKPKTKSQPKQTAKKVFSRRELITLSFLQDIN